MSDDSIYLVAGARTPFGSFMGDLRHFSAAELAIVCGQAVLERARVDASAIDSIILGHVMGLERESYYLGKYVGVRLGMPDTVTGMTVNRLCGSGLQSVVSAAQAMRLGDGAVILAGGTEAMSRAPFLLRGAREGLRGEQALEDPLLGAHSVFVDPAVGLIMGATAEEVADDRQISRVAMDEYACLSQARAAQAIATGVFAEEIVPLALATRAGTRMLGLDEHPRETSLEKLATLKPAFRQGGRVTPGNSSGINDGACVLLLATGEAVSRLGLNPLARIVSWGVAGVSGRLMGLGPVPAVERALGRCQLQLSDIDLFEINEAFAAQYLACEAGLGLDREKVNINGGAIALGHPIGASGARILFSLALSLRRRKERYGVASACIGGGQGIAVVIERV